MIAVKTDLKEMPKGCGECKRNCKSRFSDSSACRETGNSTSNSKDRRPLWCPLIEIKEVK